jgi:CDP-diacylglycerol---glycerol-3-phosphate 3-phosphatidyltransferase
LGNQTAISQRRSGATDLAKLRKTVEAYLVGGPVRLLAKTSLTPNAVSVMGFLMTLGGASLIINGRFVAGGIVVIVAAAFDMLDGALARATQRVTKFGGILDSTLDRVSESVLLLSLIPFYARQQSMPGVWLVGLALLFSYLVSYIRARAEGAGISCEVGIFTRAERVAVLALGLLLSPISTVFLTGSVAVIMTFSLISASQRLYHTWKETQK